MNHRRNPPTNLEHRSVGLEIKADDEAAGTFSGYGAVFGNEDSYGDVIERGAFKRTLGDWEKRGKYPPMLLQHGGWGIGSEDLLPVGSYSVMSEDTRGLYFEGQLLAMNTDRGQYIYQGLKAGVLDGMSIGFNVVEARYGDGKKEPARTLTDIDLWELSIVTWPANSLARVDDVKSLAQNLNPRELESFLGDREWSRRDRVKLVADLKDYFRRDTGKPINTPRDEVVSDVDDSLKSLLGTFRAASIKRTF